ncbi:hypothetical protein RISK_002829 [Rhodopirellula islandica]|uniref:Uncharacterized protein n=1 Tax=Rhodopirellula islandica TaxID=595434 RepID=A0A0J1BEQ5_RHOIS|nr:hypothetical protein RISK_002829 [Rhodopirellula islandica]
MIMATEFLVRIRRELIEWAGLQQGFAIEGCPTEQLGTTVLL